LSPAPVDEKPPASRPRGLRAFFDDRLGLESIRALGRKKTVPIHRQTLSYFLGGMALFLFVIQLVTGVLLSLFYSPSADTAFESVQRIMTEVDFGWLIRSIHSWCGDLVIGVLFLHMLTTFIMRAYRPPREFTWMTGVLLLGLFLGFGFSGYLLPWNQLAFFATRVGTAIAGAVPLLGPELVRLLRAGENVTGETLARFYAVHVAILPYLTFVLMGIHLYLVQKHGMSIPESVLKQRGSADRVRSMPFVPHFLLRDMVGWYVALGLLAALAAVFPRELGEKADPFGVAPPGLKPEWYFLFMFQTLKELPAHVLGMEGEVLGVLFFGLCGLAILLVPFLDRGPRSRRVLVVLAWVTAIFFAYMTHRGVTAP
jgi:quinol-cytochrome oxidoreductase complex cytochrome b subunit